jgi:hypothetical protein
VPLAGLTSATTILRIHAGTVEGGLPPFVGMKVAGGEIRFTVDWRRFGGGRYTGALATDHDGEANAFAALWAWMNSLRTLAATWASAGDNARQLFLMQKLDPIVRLLTSTVAETDVERMTMIDGQAPGLAGSGTQGLATRAMGTSAQLDATLGVDVLGKLAGLVSAPPSSAATSGALPVQGKPTR